MKKKTLVLGASTNPERYSNRAILKLEKFEHPVVAFGIKPGTIGNSSIETEFPSSDDIDTVTMYIGPNHQTNYISKILDLKPKRVIFNPGTENATYYKQFKDAGIEVLEACTLVMLSTNQY
jgi:predicted CoA-binding protein